MEEENVRSSLLETTDSVFEQLQPDSWTSIDHQCINGQQQSIVWEETEVKINQTHETDPLSQTLKEGRDTPEEAEQWEQIIWPVRPMTCTSPPLSCATVQWDMPGPAADTSSLVTDSGAANELDSSWVTSQDTASTSLCQSGEVYELLAEKVEEKEDLFDSWLLDSDKDQPGICSEPCDAVDVQEPSAQEEEDSTHELLGCNDEIPLRRDSAEEEGQSATSDPAETVDLTDILNEIEGYGDEVDGFVDLKLEEEREEPGVLLPGRGLAEEEHPSINCVETEERGEEEEEDQSLTNCTEKDEEAETSSCVTDVEDPAASPQADDTGPAVNPDELSDLQQPELSEESQHSETQVEIVILEQLHEDPTGQTEEPEMCKGVSQDPEQSEDAHNNEELLTQAAEDVEEIENSQDSTGKPEETSLLERQDCDQTTSEELSPQPGPSEPQQLEMTEEPEPITSEASHPADEERSGQLQEQPSHVKLAEESNHNADPPEEAASSEPTACVKAEEQPEPPEQNEGRVGACEQLVPPEETDECETREQPSAAAEAELTQHTAEPEGGEPKEKITANGEKRKPTAASIALVNGGKVDREMARRLAERLFNLDGVQRVDVVKHIDKDNDFSRAVGEEYLKFFDFTGETLDHALRSFLKVVVLIGETQERERVLQCFACRFHQCNPDSFSSAGGVLALTCALMLLNTDLHGQNVGKSMSSSKFVSNLDGMNEGENFSKDLLKSLYNSIKNEPLEWAVGEEVLKQVMPEEDPADGASLRSKANPFQDVPHDRGATVVKEGFLQRKLHADIDGKRTPWGKRGWKTFYGVLRGMVLYLQKDDYQKDQPTHEEVVSVHHSLAAQASDYTKKPHVFRLQTADWRVFLFQASSKAEMNSWINRINLVSALHSSPPFPAAVGSQRRFFRPILPALQSAHTLEKQLQSYSRMLESFKTDLSQQNLPEGKKAKAKELEEQRVRAEYLCYEICRYETYIQVLNAWEKVKKTDSDVFSSSDLTPFDKAMSAEAVGEEEDEEGLKKSHSSPSLEVELPAPAVIKVKRNISERRTYRRTIVPRWNKEA
ncbi:uncharacterized protein V6R79_005494 [Siganus canaliculatus]